MQHGGATVEEVKKMLNSITDDFKNIDSTLSIIIDDEAYVKKRDSYGKNIQSQIEVLTAALSAARELTTLITDQGDQSEQLVKAFKDAVERINKSLY